MDAKVKFTSTVVLYKRLWSYMRIYWVRFILSLIAMAVAAVTEPAFARLIKYLIDKGFVGQDHTFFKLIPILVITIFLVRAIATVSNEYLTAWLSGTIVENLRRKMFDLLLRLPVQYYDDHNSGRILSRITFDVTQITDAGFNLITVIFRDGITLLGLIGLLFYTNWRLTLICLVVFPLVFLLIRFLSYRLRKLSHINQHHYGQLTQVLTEAISGQKLVKLFGGLTYESSRFNTTAYNIKDNNVKQSTTSSLNSALSQLLIACALALILYFGIAHSHSNGFTAGSFMSFITAMIMLLTPIKRITNVTQSLQRGLTAAQSVFSFLDNAPEANTGTKLLTNIKHGIKFDNIGFRYKADTNLVLDGINLEIKVGEVVALVGSSGSGKTTLANLLARFYNPSQGSITIDGVNLLDIEISSLRSQIALVSQDVVLFNDTVYNNIAYGVAEDDIDKQRVEHAAQFANASEFIEQLPSGYNTLIGENGTKLSGGQKQRIAIARAIFKHAPLLILDEATSALDNQSEKLVQEALDKLVKSATTLVIAHRLSTILHADKIVVMNQGRIVEVGRHNELLALDGVYASLYNIQSNVQV